MGVGLKGDYLFMYVLPLLMPFYGFRCLILVLMEKVWHMWHPSLRTESHTKLLQLLGIEFNIHFPTPSV